MKLNDIKIGTQLRFGLGLIMVFVLVLGAMAWIQTNVLWHQTKDLYDHPLQVRRAHGELKADILTMSRSMKDLCLAESDQEFASILQDIDAYKTNAERQVSILHDHYLGSQNDIDSLHKNFTMYNSMCEETIRLLREGKIEAAKARTRPNGITGAQANALMGDIRKIDDFSRNKADQLYREAGEHRNALRIYLIIALGAILLLSLTVSYLLLRGILKPLTYMTRAMEQFQQGDLDTRCNYAFRNDFGNLAKTFNNMTDAIQAEMTAKENKAWVAQLMMKEYDLKSLCSGLLSAVINKTGAQVGAIYLLNEEKTFFEHYQSIGLSSENCRPFSAHSHEGEFGAALSTLKIIHIKQIPGDTVFSFPAVTGTFRPREIITIPILAQNEVAAVISLASLKAFSPLSARLINEIWMPLTDRLNQALAYRKVQVFSEKLEHQNRELEAQKKELSVQTDELSQQNIELEMQKTQLDEANRLKTSFLSNMSHELRTPLNSVIALSGVLGRRLADTIPDEEFSYLEVIERNGRHLLSLINDILDLARIESGREDLTLDRFSLKPLLEEIVAMLEPQANEKNIALINSVGGDLPIVISDRGKCRQILQNLIANAVKFTDAGQVEITAVPVKLGIRISVSDTGIGIPADRLALIFDEFRQADESTSKKYGGTGLGLAIAKKSALLLKGDIDVESAPGKGSTFAFTLPFGMEGFDIETTATLKQAETKVHAPSGISNAHLSSPAASERHILLVEDNEAAIIQLKDILTRQGYGVQVAHNGREALEQIEKRLPNAVILDLMMPEMDGFEVLKIIRGTGKTDGLPVLILTAKHVTKEELHFLKGNHIHQLIQKGDISPAELLAAVAAMVAPTLVPPLVPPLAPPVPALSPFPKPALSRPGKQVILVVEDNPDNLVTVRAILQDDYRIIEAGDGKAGVAQALAHTPDLILMDIALPVMDGIQAFKNIREMESLRQVPVIALTASAMKGNREEILAHGFDGYISKPIDPADFLKEIEAWLKK